MHGSFRTDAVLNFYKSAGAERGQDFSESVVYDFSDTCSKEKALPEVKKRKVSKLPEMVEKSKHLLEMAEGLYREDPSEENLARLVTSREILKYNEERLQGEEDNFQYSQYVDNYDFTRCVRPNGSVYGTRGKCKKGTETAKETKTSTKEASADDKWNSDRAKTLKGLKGKSKQELLSVLNQHKKVHGLSEKDSSGDIKRAILGSIHGDESPSEVKRRQERQAASRAAKRERTSEKAAGSSLPEGKVDKNAYRVKVSSKDGGFSAILQKEQQEKIRNLKDGETTSFEDEQRMHWKATRSGEKINLVGGDRPYGPTPYKVSMNRSALGEEPNKEDVAEKTAIEQLSKLLPKGEKIVMSSGREIEAEGPEFNENFDFTRCVRPNGTVYGTRGKCKKGSEQAAPAASPSKAKAKPSVKEMVGMYNQIGAGEKKLRKVLSEAKKGLKAVEKETRKDDSPEAKRKRIVAMQAFQKAERDHKKALDLMTKLINKISREKKKAQQAKMTPEQRRGERDWEKFKKTYG